MLKAVKFYINVDGGLDLFKKIGFETPPILHNLTRKPLLEGFCVMKVVRLKGCKYYIIVQKKGRMYEIMIRRRYHNWEDLSEELEIDLDVATNIFKVIMKKVEEVSQFKEVTMHG